MEYVNLETGVRVNLDELTAEEKQFYKQAIKRFRENTNWLSFDEFRFRYQISDLQWAEISY